VSQASNSSGVFVGENVNPPQRRCSQRQRPQASRAPAPERDYAYQRQTCRQNREGAPFPSPARYGQTDASGTAHCHSEEPQAETCVRKAAFFQLQAASQPDQTHQEKQRRRESEHTNATADVRDYPVEVTPRSEQYPPQSGGKPAPQEEGRRLALILFSAKIRRLAFPPRSVTPPRATLTIPRRRAHPPIGISLQRRYRMRAQPA
jgi:hypothetical protein